MSDTRAVNVKMPLVVKNRQGQYRLKPTKSFGERLKLSIKRYWFFYLAILPGLVCVAIYNYGPMILQVVLAFTNYRFVDGIFGSEWVGFNNFKVLFTQTPEIMRIIENTLVMSFWSFIMGFFPSLILAIILFDVHSRKLQRTAQTIVYIPYFFSWVIVYGIFYALLSNTGVLNSILKSWFHVTEDFLMDPKYIRTILIVSSTWKGMGWGTIIYLAAMQGIDPTLYDVAKLDGCGPIRRIFAVTLPGIRNITVFLFVLAIGSILSGGITEQILLFYNPANYSKSDTIGTWIFRIGYGMFEYSLGAALSFLQSTIGMILVLIGNHIAIRRYGVGIW